MDVLNDMTSDYSFGTHYIYNFSEVAPSSKNLLLAHGIHPGFRMKLPDGYDHYCYIEAEEPIGFQGGKLPHERGEPDTPWKLEYWDKLIHITGPNIVPYLNHVYSTDKFVPAMTPIHTKWAEVDVEKIFSVGYIGGTHEFTDENDYHELRHFCHIIREFDNSIHVSAWPHLDKPTATHCNVTDVDKMKILNRTKISVIKNSHRGNYKDTVPMLPDWDKFDWSSCIKQNKVPMLKSRVSESALCKSLMLVHRDEWNVIEMFFEPDKHFIYFNDADDLRYKITDCLNNWEWCSKITENAYNEFIKHHSSEAFYNKFLKKYDIDE